MNTKDLLRPRAVYSVMPSLSTIIEHSDSDTLNDRREVKSRTQSERRIEIKYSYLTIDEFRNETLCDRILFMKK